MKLSFHQTISRLGAVCSLLALLWVPLCWGHDIGVTKAELIEIEQGNYQLRVNASNANSVRFPGPDLPDHCAFIADPGGTQGTGWKTFEFACSPSLSANDHIILPWQRDGIMLKARWHTGDVSQQLFKHKDGVVRVDLASLQVGSGSWLDAAKRYTVLGVEHILEGYDHLAFVLALLLIVSNGWLLLKTITAFTVAHSITLALATLGYVQVSPRPVEAVIALSIVFLAMEILHADRGITGLTYRAPWLVAFGFGLLHGLGFAGALAEIGLPQSEIPVALLFFNIGVEIGQLMFIAGALLLIWLLKKTTRIRFGKARVSVSYALGTIATLWFIQRISLWFLPN